MPKFQAPSAQVVGNSDAPERLRQHNLPPGPPGYLLFQLSELQHQPIEYLSRLWQEYGDLVRLPIMPGFTLFLAAHPDHAEHILSTNQDRYRKPDFFMKPMGLVQGQGLFTSEGELWLKHRRLMQPAFHQKQLLNLHAVMLSSVQSLLNEWSEKPDGTVIDIAAGMTRLTLKMAPRVALEDDEIQGYFIPKGSIFNIAVYLPLCKQQGNA